MRAGRYSHRYFPQECADGSAGAGPDLFAGGAFIGYGPHVVELNLLILQRLDDDVGAEVGDLLFHIDVRAPARWS